MTLDIKRHLQSAGMKQTELADKVDVSRSYMSLLVSGQRDPSPALLARIAAALDVTVGDLFSADSVRATGMADHAVEPITAPTKSDLAILDIARATARHPILYAAKKSAPVFGILSGDTLVIDLRYGLRKGDIVVATRADDDGSGATGIYRWIEGTLIPSDPALPVMDTDQGELAILGLVSASFRAR
jgi:transcriptional regulator with XRE-family HTH domain